MKCDDTQRNGRAIKKMTPDEVENYMKSTD